MYIKYMLCKNKIKYMYIDMFDLPIYTKAILKAVNGN